MIAYPETNCKIVAFLRSYVLLNTFATGFFTRCFSIWLCSFQGTFRSLSIPENDTGSRRRTVNCQTLRLVFSHSHISVYRPEMKRSDFSSRFLPRKEVIQPHLPIRLPCYDFTPLTLHTFGASPLDGWAGDFGCRRLGWCDGRCVQGPGTYSPRHADPRLLATPTSCGRVAAHNLN